LAAWLAPKAASAHAIGLSSGEYRRTAEGLAVDLVFARGELSSLAETDIVAKIRVAAAGAECIGDLVESSPTERDGVRLRARYRCPNAGSPLRVRLDLFDDLSHGHRHTVRIVAGDRTLDELCYKQHAEIGVPILSATQAVAPRTSALGFVRMGFEHILSGYGFAGALADVGLVRADVPVALVSFNVGVELGQLAVLAVLMPIAWRLGRREGFRRRIVPAVSLGVVAAGAVWFVVRTTDGLVGGRTSPADGFAPKGGPSPVAEESSMTTGS
jgi:hypothetical protein